MAWERVILQICTKLKVLELEPDMFGQVRITSAKFIGTDVVSDDHRHDSSGDLKVGDFVCIRSGPLYLRNPAVGGDCDE